MFLDLLLLHSSPPYLYLSAHHNFLKDRNCFFLISYIKHTTQCLKHKRGPNKYLLNRWVNEWMNRNHEINYSTLKLLRHYPQSLQEWFLLLMLSLSESWSSENLKLPKELSIPYLLFLTKFWTFNRMFLKLNIILPFLRTAAGDSHSPTNHIDLSSLSVP